MTLDGLDSLRRRFIDRTRRDRDGVEAWRSEGLPRPTPMEHVIHNMTGVAGTLGFMELYEAAARIDDRFAVDEAPGVDEVTALLDAIDRLEAPSA